jgi:hypothetical protein
MSQSFVSFIKVDCLRTCPSTRDDLRSASRTKSLISLGTIAAYSHIMIRTSKKTELVFKSYKISSRFLTYQEEVSETE